MDRKLRVFTAAASLLPLRAHRAMDLFARVLEASEGVGWGAQTVDQEVAAVVHLVPRAGGVVVDGGCHRGDWTAALLRRVTPKIVLAIEPDPVRFDRLKERFTEPVTLVNAALSDRTGRATLYDLQGATVGSVHASLYQLRLDHRGRLHEPSREVNTVTLDDLAKERRIGRIDLLKLDIEGAELSALLGGRSLLDRGAIRAVAFEMGPATVVARAFLQDFWLLLTSRGYRLHRIVPGGRLFPLEAYNIRLETFAPTNYVAVLASPPTA